MFVAALGLLAVGCLGASAVPCGSGVCAPDSICVAEAARCARPEQAICGGMPDGTPCTLGGTGDGACQAGYCFPQVCGDGIVSGAEQCDGEVPANITCEERGFYRSTGPITCSPACTLDVSSCRQRCGDGVVDAEFGEVCDRAALAGATCMTQEDPPFHGGTLGCAPDCLAFDVRDCMGYCGDGVATGGEECDGTDLGGTVCAPDPACAGPSPPAACATHAGFGAPVCASSGCVLDLAGCARPGNGIVDAREDCDGADLGGRSCVNFGFNGGQLRCGPCTLDDPSCTFDTSLCTGFCGDGVLNGDEECDGLVQTQTCTDLGAVAGVVECDATCRATTDKCRYAPSWQVGTANPAKVFAHVAVVEANDVWAVARPRLGIPGDDVLVHFDGRAQRTLPSPLPAGVRVARLWAEHAASVWVIGETTACRFDGFAWTCAAALTRALDAWSCGDDLWVVDERLVGGEPTPVAVHCRIAASAALALGCALVGAMPDASAPAAVHGVHGRCADAASAWFIEGGRFAPLLWRASADPAAFAEQLEVTLPPLTTSAVSAIRVLEGTLAHERILLTGRSGDLAMQGLAVRRTGAASATVQAFGQALGATVVDAWGGSRHELWAAEQHRDDATPARTEPLGFTVLRRYRWPDGQNLQQLDVHPHDTLVHAIAGSGAGHVWAGATGALLRRDAGGANLMLETTEGPQTLSPAPLDLTVLADGAAARLFAATVHSASTFAAGVGWTSLAGSFSARELCAAGPLAAPAVFGVDASPDLFNSTLPAWIWHWTAGSGTLFTATPPPLGAGERSIVTAVDLACASATDAWALVAEQVMTQTGGAPSLSEDLLTIARSRVYRFEGTTWTDVTAALTGGAGLPSLLSIEVIPEGAATRLVLAGDGVRYEGSYLAGMVPALVARGAPGTPFTRSNLGFGTSLSVDGVAWTSGQISPLGSPGATGLVGYWQLWEPGAMAPIQIPRPPVAPSTALVDSLDSMAITGAASDGAWRAMVGHDATEIVVVDQTGRLQTYDGTAARRFQQLPSTQTPVPWAPGRELLRTISSVLELPLPRAYGGACRRPINLYCGALPADAAATEITHSIGALAEDSALDLVALGRPGLATPGQERVYRFDSPITGTLELATVASQPGLVVYALPALVTTGGCAPWAAWGAAPPAPVVQTSTAPVTLSVPVVAGQAYYLVLDSQAPLGPTSYRLAARCRPELAR